MNKKQESPLRPAQFAQQKIMTSILDGTFPCGSNLPSERSLAEIIGVTRPTLRETLQRLGSEGWVTINHGKPTVVNDYWKDGGLGILSTMVKYGTHFPDGFISNLLDVRAVFLPPIAGKAARNHPGKIVQYLEKSNNIENNEKSFAKYDWGLQLLLADCSDNPIYKLILNDFKSVFYTMGFHYFKDDKNRDISRRFYCDFLKAVSDSPEASVKVVRDAMEKSIEIWRSFSDK